MTSTTTDRLADALQEYQLLLELALPIDKAAFLGRYPELPDLSKDLATLDALHDAAMPPAQKISVYEPQLNDFQIIREIGRGGMGTVYEARQLSLDRTVAIKVLTGMSGLESRARQRFLHEARVGALLADINIVPVYHVGEEQSTPYFVMRYVAGGSLADALRHFRSHATPWKTLPEPQTKEYFLAIARLLATAASAISVAHQHGIIHRDIKPANLLLEEDGKLWVSDFGLAFTPLAEPITQTGERPGTLRYMSPEQLTGPRDRIDGRSDIFSLGATLYELTTLRPLFEGDSTHLLARMVADQPTSTPRSICPALPRDLETIILKATAPNLADRYSSAQELADDLLRFADGQPILASRLGFARKASRWMSRHRRPLIAAGIIAVATIATVQLLTWRAYRSESRARSLAIAAVINLGKSADSILSHAPGMEAQTIQYLTECRDIVEPFANDTSLPISARLDIAWITYRLAYACELAGRYPEAEAAFRDVITRIESLAIEAPANAALPRDLSQAHESLGVCFQFQDRLDEAHEEFHLAKIAAERAYLLNPNSPTLIVRLGEIQMIVADQKQRISGDSDTAIRDYRDVAKSFEALRDRYPTGHPRSYMRLISTWTVIANKCEAAERFDEAEAAYQKAMEAHDVLANEFRDQPFNVREFGWRVPGSWGRLLCARGQTQKGKQKLRQSIDLFEEAVRIYPNVPNFRDQLILQLSRLTAVEFLSDDLVAARSTAKRCAELLDITGASSDLEIHAAVWVALPFPDLRSEAVGNRLLSRQTKLVPPSVRAGLLLRHHQPTEALKALTSETDVISDFVRACCLAKSDPTSARRLYDAATLRFAKELVHWPEIQLWQREAAGRLNLSPAE
jgi:eukaryotic-like serine/threonine-protein kinase